MFDLLVSTWWGITLICLISFAVLLLLSAVFYKLFFKRLYDVISSFILLVLFFIFIFPIVAIAIKIEDKGPIFYCGKRIGKNGKAFKMVKFRSMKVNAPDIRLDDGSTFNGENDSRVTKVGKFLRKTSIDELPQLINVLIGQMSLIGPRPDPLDWLERYEEGQKDFLKVKPGITGYNQAYYRNSSDSQEKIRLDNFYANKVSLWMDIKIFFKTFHTVLLAKNVYRDTEKPADRLLIIGAGNLQLPAVLKAKEMGFYTAVLDYNPNSVGIEFADEYFNCSTNDAEGMLKAAKTFKPDGIMTMATDMPMKCIASVCQEVQLRSISYETALLCTDKYLMIQKFSEKGVACPWFQVISDSSEIDAIAGEIEFPCIMKPVDSSGSRGVSLCESVSDLIDSFSYSIAPSSSKKVIIEEYMQGPEVSVEVFVEDGIPNILQITDKLTTGAPHFVEMGHSQPSCLPVESLEKIKSLAGESVLALGIENGPAHVEIIVTKDGPKIVELGARMGGDCITSHLVPLSTGIDMIANTINFATNRALDLKPKFEKASAVRYLKTNQCGTIKSIKGVEEAKAIEGIVEVCFLRKIGEKICPVLSSTDRVAYVISQADDSFKAIELCEMALSKIEIEVDDDE